MSDSFDEVCPYYLSIGMTYNQYWHGDPEIAVHFRKAEQIRNDKRNQEMFWQGAYIYQALCAVSPVLHAFAKKGTQPNPYLDEPLPLTKKQAQEQAQRRYQEKVKRFQEQAEARNARKRSERENGKAPTE